MRKINGFIALALASAGAVLGSPAALADFQGAAVPTSVTVLYCDNNPRIVVTFADSSQNVWYPANQSDQSKEFLSVAMAAKTTGQSLFYYGSGTRTLTAYCLSTTAAQVF